MAPDSSSIIDFGKVDRIERKFVPWVIVSLSLSIYLLTLSRHYTADSLLYALDIENGSLQDLVDPTHLALHPIGWIWYQLWKGLGWSNGSILPLGALNALAGAICIGLVLVIALRLSDSLITSLLSAIGFAVSGATWLLSVEAEFVTVPLVSNLLVLYLLIGSSESVRKSRHYSTALGIVTAIAILMYANNVFLILVVGCVLWFRTGPPIRRQIATIVSYIRPVIFLAVPALAVGLWLWTNGDWSMLSQFRESDSYGRFSWFNIPQGIYALMRSIALYHGLAMNDSTEMFLRDASTIERFIFYMYYGLVVVVASLPILLGMRFRVALLKRHRLSILALIVWSTLYALFAFFWVPGDISFWMPILVAWWLLVCMLITIIPSTYRRSRTIVQAFTGTIIAILLLLNSALVILPRRDISTNSFYQMARGVNYRTESEAIVFADEGRLETIFLAYFSDRAVVPVDKFQLENTDMDRLIKWINFDGSGVEQRVYIFKDGILSKLEP